MKKNLCLFSIGVMGLISNAYAAPRLMTAQDINRQAVSNVSIVNRTNSSVTVYGLYVASFDVNDCSVCFGSIISGDNVFGTFVGPVVTRPNQRVSIGQNYLYNIIYNGLYGVQQNGSSPCYLPGCTWPGDDPNVQGWCITLGAMSLNSNYTFSNYTNGSNPPANVVPFLHGVNNSGLGYKYDLIDPNTIAIGGACIGPIVCDDKSLTCSVSTPQSESFQPY